MGSGGAATSLSVLQFFEDIGVPICEGVTLLEFVELIYIYYTFIQYLHLRCIAWGVCVCVVE